LVSELWQPLQVMPAKLWRALPSTVWLNDQEKSSVDWPPMIDAGIGP
jgi:hypothetical protein